MKTLLTLAILIVTLLTTRVAAIDFTPRFSESVEDGIPMRRMSFSDGARPIFYRPHASWSFSGDQQAATFAPKDSREAIVKIENAPAEHARIPFDEPGLEALRKIAFTLVPQGATDVVAIWEVVNPVVLQGWTSFEMGFDYLHFGRRCCRSVLFINLDANRQIHFVVDAAPAEFSPLYRTAYRTLATWWQPPSATAL